uniref:YspC n=1 Tax=Sodalis glossinidius TaxID=63612 RepID=Q6R8C4_SODGL|nr:YspC [Sodalis glossinidius]
MSGFSLNNSAVMQQQYPTSYTIGNTSAEDNTVLAKVNRREASALNKSDVEGVTQAGALYTAAPMIILFAPNAKKANDPEALKQMANTVATYYSTDQYAMASYTVEVAARNAAQDLNVDLSTFSVGQKRAATDYAEIPAKMRKVTVEPGVLNTEFSASQKITINNYAVDRAKLEFGFANNIDAIANKFVADLNGSNLKTPEDLAVVTFKSADSLISAARAFAKNMGTTVSNLAKGLEGENKFAEEQAAVVSKFSEGLDQVEKKLATERASNPSVMLGSDLSFEALLRVIGLTTEMCNENNKLSAHFGELMAKAANQSAKKLVDAAGVRLGGVIASAAIQMTAAYSSAKQKVGAWNKEGASAKANLGEARNMQKGLSESENSILTSQSKLVAKGTDMSSDVGAGLRKSHPQQKADIMTFEMQHQQVQRETGITVAGADVLAAMGRGSSDIVSRAFNVAAASNDADSKKLDASKELASTLSAMANKTSDTNQSNRDKLLQTLQSVISRTQDTNSVIAGNMRG